MTTRTYDYKLTLAGAEHFVPGLMAIGNTSQTVGEIIAQDLSNNVIKVKVNNTSMQYQGLENIHCNLIQNYSIDAIQKYANLTSQVFATINGSYRPAVRLDRTNNANGGVGTGVGGNVMVTVLSDATYSVAFPAYSANVNPGAYGYLVDDTITITGNNIGGATTTNDLTLTVTSVTDPIYSIVTGQINTFTVAGTSILDTRTEVNGNAYSINGSTNTFALPLTTTDSATTLDFANLSIFNISVMVDNVYPISRSLINYPSVNATNGLGKAGIDFKPVPFNPAGGMVQLTVNSAGNPIDENGVQIDVANLKARYVSSKNTEIKHTYQQTGTWKGRSFDNPGGTYDGEGGYQRNQWIPPTQADFAAAAVQFYSAYPDSFFEEVIRNNNNNIITYASWPFSTASNLSIRVVTGNTESVPFTAAAYRSTTTLTTNVIAKIENSGFIRAKNAFEQPPLIRLYDIFYPGEWYPPNAFGNPSKLGQGLAWPFGFPYRFAEVRGDIISDISYRAWHDGDAYMCYPIDSGSIGLNQTGEINETTVTISNFDSLIAQVVENSFLVGNCANANTGTVNFGAVHNLDPSTIVNHTNDPYGNNYDQSVVDSTYGGIANSAITYDRCIELNGTWKSGKQDSRDLLGGIVRIRSTFATFLDYWPEYSTIRSITGNVVELYSTAPYRINDNVTIKGTRGNYAAVKNIVGNFIELDSSLNIGVGTNLMIVNPDADPDAYVEDVFKVDKLNALDGAAAVFSLTSWLQYFKLTFPRRKYYKNTCPWVYQGEECQYPISGTGLIPGTSATTALTANGFWTVKNVQVDTVSANDECAKSFVACKLRNNQIHFGGFIGTGRTVPMG